MYKVQTNQLNISLHDLLARSEKQQKEEEKAQYNRAVEEAVAQLKREAQEVAARQRPLQRMESIPKLLPAPVLLPTAYSSRMIYDARFPSSPPASVSPERAALPVGTPQRLESPMKFEQ